MKTTCRQMRLRLLQAITIVACIFLASTGNAGTLYERSLAKMSTREQKGPTREFTFVVLGDSRDNDVVFKKSLALAASFNPLFIIHDGDFSRDGTPQEVDHFLEVVQGTIPDIPLFVVRGNHEQQEPFLEKIGPRNYVIDSARFDCKVIVTDNAGYALRPAELDYLNRQLEAKRRFTFVSMHIPPATKRWTWHTFSDGAPALIRLLSEKGVTAAFYGHVHLFDRDDLQGVPHIITGGAGAQLVSFGFPGDPVYHIVVVRVKDGVVSFSKVEIPN